MITERVKANKVDERISENFTKIKIGGEAEIISGNTVIQCTNKFTRYLMSTILVAICNSYKYAYVDATYQTLAYHTLASLFDSRVGRDTSTPTNPDMSDLVDKEDVAPSSKTRKLIRDEEMWLFMVEFTFRWDAGVLPDMTIGELGVYLRTDNDDWTSGLVNPERFTTSGAQIFIGSGSGKRLCSRIASADGAFDAFEFYGSIDPLTFKWRFQVAIL